jgi:hypothetical protein
LRENNILCVTTVDVLEPDGLPEREGLAVSGVVFAAVTLIVLGVRVPTGTVVGVFAAVTASTADVVLQSNNAQVTSTTANNYSSESFSHLWQFISLHFTNNSVKRSIRAVGN